MRKENVAAGRWGLRAVLTLLGVADTLQGQLAGGWAAQGIEQHASMQAPDMSVAPATKPKWPSGHVFTPGGRRVIAAGLACLSGRGGPSLTPPNSRCVFPHSRVHNLRGQQGAVRQLLPSRRRGHPRARRAAH